VADFWEQWSSNPSENNQAPPTGAGEKKMPFDQITDTFRVVMAACAQLGVRLNSLGGISGQEPGNVNITGGNIGPNVNIDATSVRSGLLDLARLPTTLTGKLVDNLTLAGRQQLYNWVNPVGIIKLWHASDSSGSGGLVWPGLTASWEVVAGTSDMIIVTAGGQTGLINGAGADFPAVTMGTTVNGAHSHGGGTGGTILSRAHMPSDAMVDVSIAGTGGVIGTGSQGLNKTFGGGGAHGHGIGADGDHGHNVAYNPRRFAFAIVHRTA
jgi:hypothetical protein